MKHDLPEYSNAQMAALIDDHLHRRKDRDILKLRLLDGLTYEQIAENQDMSVRQIKNIVYKALQTLIRYI